MSSKHDLIHSIIMTVKHNKDSSFNTRDTRKKRLLLIAEQLAEGGYKIAHIQQLKIKHVEYLVNLWLEQGLSAGTIKNRMTDLRWVMNKYGKADLIPNKNGSLNIPQRQYVTNKDKSVTVSDADISKITDADVRMSLVLQRAFGLRREESIKIRLHEAVVGDELRLKGSWCKNGRARSIQIQYPEQWDAIHQVKAHLGNSERALIPAHRNYIEQQTIYDRQTSEAGLHKLHGLRHAYAQRQYEVLTGWNCPAKGGPTSQQLTFQQKQRDQLARLQISHLLGHDRVDVVAIYCGK